MHSIVKPFAIQWLILPNQRSHWFSQEVKVNLDKASSCYLMSLMTLKKIVSKKLREILNFATILSFFLSTSDVALLKTVGNPITVSYILMSVTVFFKQMVSWFRYHECSKFEDNCTFNGCNLFPCRFNALLTVTLQKKHRLLPQSNKLNLFQYIAICFNDFQLNF